jgi:hypothetical protein
MSSVARLTADRARLQLSATTINNCIEYSTICNLQRISSKSISGCNLCVACCRRCLLSPRGPSARSLPRAEPRATRWGPTRGGHSFRGAGRGPSSQPHALEQWIPAFAGMMVGPTRRPQQLTARHVVRLIGPESACSCFAGAPPPGSLSLQ